MSGSKFLLRMFPTARYAFERPAAAATCAYVIVDPFGIFRTTSRTRSANGFDGICLMT